jgi:hypothetical protein
MNHRANSEFEIWLGGILFFISSILIVKYLNDLQSRWYFTVTPSRVLIIRQSAFCWSSSNHPHIYLYPLLRDKWLTLNGWFEVLINLHLNHVESVKTTERLSCSCADPALTLVARGAVPTVMTQHHQSSRTNPLIRC